MVKSMVAGAGMALALLGTVMPLSAQETAAPAAPPVTPRTDLSADTVVATVNGTDITLGHMIVLRQTLPEQYQALPDDVLFAGILDQIVQQTVLEQSVTPTLGKRDTLALQNETRNFLSGLALQKATDGAVTDAALQAAYDARFKDAPPQTEYNASHILVDSEEKAKELKAQIDSGADFAELARTNSTDGAAANGGSLGWFGMGMMVKPFEDAVVAMKAGEVAGPIQTQFGWHLVKLNETRPAAVPTLDELRAELTDELQRNAMEAQVADLTAKATVTRADAGIDPAVLKDLTLLDK